MSQPEVCAHKGCGKPVGSRTGIVARNGEKYCKYHGEKLPSYLRGGGGGSKGGAKTRQSRLGQQSKPISERQGC
jgi:hypothetical protein